MSLQEKIDRINNELDAVPYTVTTGVAVKIIEIVFRDFCYQAITLMSFGVQSNVLRSEIGIRKGRVC